MRTSGSAVTRDSDDMTSERLPQRILSGRYKFSIVQAFGDTEYTGKPYILDPGSGEALRINGSKQIELLSGGSLKVSSNTLSWSRWTEMTVIIDAESGTIEVQGADSGNGESGGNAWSWSDDGGAQVGSRVTLSDPFYGLISNFEVA
jgi:hypothetical protein